MAVGQNPVLVNIKIDGAWLFIRPKMEAYVMTHGHMGMDGMDQNETTRGPHVLVLASICQGFILGTKF